MEDQTKMKVARLRVLVQKPRAFGKMDRDDRAFLDTIRAELGWALDQLDPPKPAPSPEGLAKKKSKV